MAAVNECDDDAEEWMGGYEYPSLCWMVRGDDWGDERKFLGFQQTWRKSQQTQRVIATITRRSTQIYPRINSLARTLSSLPFATCFRVVATTALAPCFTKAQVEPYGFPSDLGGAFSDRIIYNPFPRPQLPIEYLHLYLKSSV
jgi:hypothetical protein